ncbi:hypothetical protein V5799_032920 [Amblyomma americanum]|uniref:Uncharacterized protein n=1 Tax=Amblyomma americanum TaxID=6943 RepID=A0AAQ4DPT3_AMBAM
MYNFASCIGYYIRKCLRRGALNLASSFFFLRSHHSVSYAIHLSLSWRILSTTELLNPPPETISQCCTDLFTLSETVNFLRFFSQFSSPAISQPRIRCRRCRMTLLAATTDGISETE